MYKHCAKHLAAISFAILGAYAAIADAIPPTKVQLPIKGYIIPHENHPVFNIARENVMDFNPSLDRYRLFGFEISSGDLVDLAEGETVSCSARGGIRTSGFGEVIVVACTDYNGESLLVKALNSDVTIRIICPELRSSSHDCNGEIR